MNIFMSERGQLDKQSDVENKIIFISPHALKLSSRGKYLELVMCPEEGDSEIIVLLTPESIDTFEEIIEAAREQYRKRDNASLN